MPSGPSRLTACFTRSVRPQLSMRKPRSCRNFASAEAASSLLEAQTQSSVLKGNSTGLTRQAKRVAAVLSQSSQIGLTLFFPPLPGIKYRSGRGKKQLSSVTADVMFGFFCMCIKKGLRAHLLAHTHAHCILRIRGESTLSEPYRSWRGSQSTPGSSSLAACRTSSLSTEKLRLCSV